MVYFGHSWITIKGHLITLIMVRRMYQQSRTSLCIPKQRPKIAVSLLGAQWDSFASLKRLRRWLSLRSSDFVDDFRFAQATSSMTTLMGSYTTVHKKERPTNRSLFWVPSGILSLCSSDFVDDEPLWVHTPPDTKKGSRKTSSFGCPVGFEPTTFRTTIWRSNQLN